MVSVLAKTILKAHDDVEPYQNPLIPIKAKTNRPRYKKGNKINIQCQRGMLVLFRICIILGTYLMGLAAEPICGLAATLFVSLTDILSSDQHHLWLWDERPVVAGVVP
jgi:hypothetical protein